MKKIQFMFIAIFAAILLSMLPLTGCGKRAQWADPIVDNVLISINNEDYSSFIKDFGDGLIKEISKNNFQEV